MEGTEILNILISDGIYGIFTEKYSVHDFKSAVT